VELNRAASANGLRFWVDVQGINGKPILLTYELEKRTPWKMGASQVDVLRVRRLDRLNIEMGMEGLTNDEGPAVFLDRLEPNLTYELQQAFAEKSKGNSVDRAVQASWRSLIEARAGAAALAAAAGQLERRAKLFSAMESRMHEGQVRFWKPDGFVWGEEFFERLEPYAKAGRPRGPLVLASDLRDLRRADEALRRGEGRRALDVALELEAQLVEAHEARHALDPAEKPVPPALLETVGDDDLAFAGKAERELRADFAELRDAKAPPCLAMLRIVQEVGGRYARATPHWYAGTVLLRTIYGTEAAELDALPAKACADSDPELRNKAGIAYRALYGEDFPASAPESGAASVAEAVAK
jgi:hypothetical protein